MKVVYIVGIVVVLVLVAVSGFLYFSPEEPDDVVPVDKLLVSTKSQVFDGFGSHTVSGRISDVGIVFEYWVNISYPFDCGDGMLFIDSIWPYTVFGSDQFGFGEGCGLADGYHTRLIRVSIFEFSMVVDKVFDDVTVSSQSYEFGFYSLADGRYNQYGYYVVSDAYSYIDSVTDSLVFVVDAGDWWFEV